MHDPNSEQSKIKEFILSTDRNYLFFSIECALVSFYGNLFIVFSIIWKLHGQSFHKMLTKAFILISHSQIQRGKKIIIFLKQTFFNFKALCPELGFWNIIAVLISVLAQMVAGHFTQKYIGMFTNTFD